MKKRREPYKNKGKWIWKRNEFRKKRITESSEASASLRKAASLESGLKRLRPRRLRDSRLSEGCQCQKCFFFEFSDETLPMQAFDLSFSVSDFALGSRQAWRTRRFYVVPQNSREILQSGKPASVFGS